MSEARPSLCECGHGLPPNHMTTDSSLPDEHFTREAAILHIAGDALLGHDSATAENALRWARSLMDEHENEAHSGDCTREAHACLRCICDDAKVAVEEIERG